MTQIPQNVVEPPAEQPGKVAQGAPGKPLSPLFIAWRNLRKHRLAMVSLVVLVLMYLAMLFDGFVAPYPYNSWDRGQAYHPAGNLHVFDAEGRFHLRPFVYASHYDFDEYRDRIWREDTSRRYPLKLFVRGETGTMLFGTVETNWHLFGVEAPARLYLLGADWQGRDILSRIIFGGRVSLTIGIMGTSIAMLIGMIVGGVSGYVGGAGDNVIQRICELIMLIPGFYTLMILYNTLPASLTSTQVYFGVVVILAFISWASLARVIRGMVLSVKSSDFVMAARAGGSSPWRVVTRHVLPSTFSYAIVAASLQIPAYILGEAGLSVIGMGVQEPVPTWGNMLQQAKSVTELTFHPWLLWPGVAIFVTVMAFNFLGDGLRDALDPRTVGLKKE
jgi:peptide/nickel transport system permease protein